MSFNPAALIAALAGLVAATVNSQEVNRTEVDFRYAPPQWQTSICFPDDPNKSLVDRSGELLYDYGKGEREFGTRIGIEVAPLEVWQRQELQAPRVPIVRTVFNADNLEIHKEAFALSTPAERTTTGNPLANTRSDVVLVRVRNTGRETRTVNPKLIVDTTLRFSFEPATQRAQINGRQTVACSLRMRGLQEQQSRRAIELAPISLAPGQSSEFFIVYSDGDGPKFRTANTSEWAIAARERAIKYWESAPLPYGRVEVPDPGIQGLLDSSIRNIWQAREIKKGLPAFQVGPTCYRGLWIVDGAFLLEAAAMLGAGQDARSGVAYELTYQREDGSIHVMDNYSKENGIVLWTCVRHARLTQDKQWLETLWPKLERIAGYIRTLRLQTLTNASPRDDGLVPAGFPDGGIGGVMDEYTNPYWNLAGLHAFVQAAQWLGKDETAAIWQKEYDGFIASFRRAAARDMKTDPAGHSYLPARMDGQDLPQRGQWAFCHAVYPGQIFAKDDPLVANMLAMLRATEREGMVYGTGWDPHGIWNYFGSFYAHAWLWQGNGGKSAEVLTAYANHAAPTLVWREEQSLRGEKFNKVGDMPHNWASAEFIRLVIHSLALDRGDELRLLEGLPKEWLKPGMVTRLNGVATPFGPVYMTLTVSKTGNEASLTVKPIAANCKAVIVHLPQGETRTISPDQGATLAFSIPPGH